MATTTPTTMTERFKAFSKRFKLDSHHTMERSGLFMGFFACLGVIVLVCSGFSAAFNGRGEFNDRAVWTDSFQTSKTDLSGKVDGVYTNAKKTRALVLMHFDSQAQISYNAADYQAWLLGSDENQGTQGLKTPGIKGSVQMFGSTGYVGVYLDAQEPFAQQVMNLTMRSNSELSVNEGATTDSSDVSELANGDDTFRKHDQWRVYVNPGANKTTTLPALNDAHPDPAKVYYETVAKSAEKDAKDKLDAKLLEMRSNLNQINAYTDDLATTKVDGLFLRPPEVPSIVKDDEITGKSAAEADNHTSSLALRTKTVVPGGFNINWRAGNAYDGYLDAVVPDGESYINYLSKKRDESSNSDDTSVDNLKWTLSDGSDLNQDYQSSDVTMRPLFTVMNNLSQAYQDYASNKTEYQSSLMLNLLYVDVDLRDVQSNSSLNTTKKVLVTYYE